MGIETDHKKLLTFAIVILLVGIITGYGVGYTVYKPHINTINTEVSVLETNFENIQTKLATIESQNKDLKEDIDILESNIGIEQLHSDVAQLESTNIELKSDIENLKKVSAISEEQAVIDVYETVAPAVVFITSTVLSYDFQMGDMPEEGVGSGSIVSLDGYILTNNHVVEDADSITVSLKSGEEIEANLIGTDPITDLAVIKIDPIPNLPVVELGDSDQIKVGQKAIAIGNPFSLDQTITTGVVSSLNRTLDTETGDILVNLIQTDASINPGNSGGPLLNSKGEVIGVNSLIISPAGGSVGIGFAISINTAKDVMKQLIENGKVSRPHLGITGASVGELPAEIGLQASEGVLIVDVFVGSPADKASLRGSDFTVTINMIEYPAGGDIITTIDGDKIETIGDILVVLSRKDVGDEIQVEYIRYDNTKGTVKVVLEERP